MAQKMGPVYARGDYAGFWRRTAAILFDLILLWVLQSIVVWSWYWLAPAPWQTRRVYLWIYTTMFALWWAYMIGLRLTMKGTLGYRLMRIRYAYMLDEKPTAMSILFRSLMAVVLLFVFALDHLWILCDKRKQAWHDKVSGFYVVKAKAEPVGKTRVVQRVVYILGYTFIVWETAGDGEPPPNARGLPVVPVPGGGVHERETSQTNA